MKKKNKTPASVQTGLYILFKSMFYIDRLHVRMCLYCQYWCILDMPFYGIHRARMRNHGSNAS